MMALAIVGVPSNRDVQVAVYHDGTGYTFVWHSHNTVSHIAPVQVRLSTLPSVTQNVYEAKLFSTPGDKPSLPPPRSHLSKLTAAIGQPGQSLPVTTRVPSAWSHFCPQGVRTSGPSYSPGAQNFGLVAEINELISKSIRMFPVFT